MRVTIVTASDWQGLYINGQLIDQNHSLDVMNVLEAIRDAQAGVPSVLAIDTYEANESWLELQFDGFPEQLHNVVLR